MLKLKALMITGLAASLFTLNVFAKAADTNMTPPQPLQNKTFDAMVGTWEGDSDMMGTKMHQTLKIQWALNHQFLLMQLESHATQSNAKYEGMGVLGVTGKGTAKTWWFDSWGADAASTGTGIFSGNKLTLHDANAMFSEVRSFEVNGNQMTMKAKGTMKWQGKPTSFNETTVYKKQ